MDDERNVAFRKSSMRCFTIKDRGFKWPLNGVIVRTGRQRTETGLGGGWVTEGEGFKAQEQRERERDGAGLLPRRIFEVKYKLSLDICQSVYLSIDRYYHDFYSYFFMNCNPPYASPKASFFPREFGTPSNQGKEGCLRLE